MRLVQEGLIAEGFALPGSTKPTGELDGIFGSETQGAVRQFQVKFAAEGLTDKGFGDGRVGRRTMGKLDDLATAGEAPPPKEELPACPLPGGGSLGFVAGPRLGLLGGIPIPGITCQLKGLSVDALDLARVRVDSFKVNKPTVIRESHPDIKKLSVTIEPELLVEAKASLLPGLSRGSFTFGFVQVCRPFDTVRATYVERGAARNSGNDADLDASMAIRSGKQDSAGNFVRKPLPAIDHLGTFADMFGGKLASGKPKPPVVSGGSSITQGTTGDLTFLDRPRQPFGWSELLKSTDLFDITGVAYGSFFFTAFVVMLPSGRIEPLRTFFWDMTFCEEFKPGPGDSSYEDNLSKKVLGKAVNISPAKNCQAGSCDAGEPGFDKAGQKRTLGDTCLAITDAAVKDTTLIGPGSFSIGCS